MLGLPGAAGFAAPTPAPAAAAPVVASNAPANAPNHQGPRPVAQKTIMGITSPFVAGLQTPLHAQQKEPAKQQEAPAATASPAASNGASARSADAGSSGGSAAKDNHKRTVMGIAPPAEFVKAIREANANAAKAEPQPAPAAPAAAPAALAPKTSSASPLNKTMLGVAAPLPLRPGEDNQPVAQRQPTTPLIQQPAPPSPQVTPESKVSPKSDRTMLGHAAQALPSDPPPAAESEHPFTPPEPARPTPSLSLDVPQQGVPASGPMRAVLAALGGALFVLALGLIAWHFLGSRGPDLSVAVVQTDDGEALAVKVPKAAPGTRVRFLGSEQELKAGEASFPLAADTLALGDNEIVIGVVHGAEVEATSVRLDVSFRSHVDTAGLAKNPAQIDLVIDALPGSKVTVDGKPVQLDAKGHGVQSFPVAAQSTGKLPFSAKYKVVSPNGSTSERAYSLTLPVSSLQIDRPGASLTTDQANVEVAGAVESNAEVTVDGAPVKVNDGRFLTRVRLPKPGDYTIRVLARAPNKAPRSADLKVARVTDLTLAAASFKADPALNYAKLAQNPVIYKGTNAAFDGRVYNVEVKAGASHLQMLVRDCPASQRCPLWVELPQATDVTVDSWVRVLGEVAGEQQFRSERGQVHTVPSVKAQFVLKLAR